jgi:hypothetical protein
VVLTLVILVIGVRENTDTIRATAAAESRDSLSSLDDLIVTPDDDILDVLGRVTDREVNWADLTSTEQLRMGSLVRAFLRRAIAQFFRYRNGLLDEDAWRTVLARVVTNLQSPSFAEVWEI